MMDIFSFDNDFRIKGVEIIAGIDEAGRGPLAGPVVASAVILREDGLIPGLNDSKKLSSRKIESLFWEITAQSVSIGIGIVGAPEIDSINILNATKKAMITAVKDLSVTPDLIMIDAMTLDKCPVSQKSIIKGDGKSASIAAASVIAKHVRDSMMNDYHRLYPEYGFNQHKGYGTQRHREKINQYGPCPIHRRSFSPVTSLSLPLGDM